MCDVHGGGETFPVQDFTAFEWSRLNHEKLPAQHYCIELLVGSTGLSWRLVQNALGWSTSRQARCMCLDASVLEWGFPKRAVMSSNAIFVARPSFMRSNPSVRQIKGYFSAPYLHPPNNYRPEECSIPKQEAIPEKNQVIFPGPTPVYQENAAQTETSVLSYCTIP